MLSKLALNSLCYPTLNLQQRQPQNSLDPDLRHRAVWPQPPQCWDDRYVPPCLANSTHTILILLRQASWMGTGQTPIALPRAWLGRHPFPLLTLPRFCRECLVSGRTRAPLSPLYSTRFIREQSMTFSGWHRAGIWMAHDGSLQVSREAERTHILGNSGRPD